MPTLIRNREVEARVRAEWRAAGLDRWDEVWDGVYVMPPFPNDEHQAIQAELVAILQSLIGWKGQGKVRAGVNVSDRIDDWTHNYRCPDVAVFLNGSDAQNHNTFWFGGPDFAVEIVSPDDSSRDKLGFYASVGVRELLIIDRAPWRLELYRLASGRMVEVGHSVPTLADALVSEIVPLSFRLIAGGARPSIEVTERGGPGRWVI
jgi:Uma2 family endonuclease